LQWAGEVAAYLNKTCSLNIKFGIELFGAGWIHWHFETDSLEMITATNARSLQDREYAALLDKAQSLWLEGGLRDTIRAILG